MQNKDIIRIEESRKEFDRIAESTRTPVRLDPTPSTRRHIREARVARIADVGRAENQAGVASAMLIAGLREAVTALHARVAELEQYNSEKDERVRELSFANVALNRDIDRRETRLRPSPTKPPPIPDTDESLAGRAVALAHGMSYFSDQRGFNLWRIPATDTSPALWRVAALGQEDGIGLAGGIAVEEWHQEYDAVRGNYWQARPLSPRVEAKTKGKSR